MQMAKRARHSQWGQVRLSEEEVDVDRFPIGDRFERMTIDVGDRECAPIPVPPAEQPQAIARGRELFSQRRKRQRDENSIRIDKHSKQMVEDALARLRAMQGEPEVGDMLDVAEEEDDEDAELNAMIEQLEIQVEEAHQAHHIYSRARLAVRPLRERCMGDMRLARIREVLNKMGMTRSHQQRLFHNAFIIACLPKIYGKRDWAIHCERVLKEFGIDRIRYEVMIQTARRQGKSESIAMFVAAVRTPASLRYALCSALSDTVANLCCCVWEDALLCARHSSVYLQCRSACKFESDDVDHRKAKDAARWRGAHSEEESGSVASYEQYVSVALHLTLSFLGGLDRATLSLCTACTEGCTQQEGR